jgi:DNA-directed RNA polymerase specialized sigma24 family protein|tara:strand:+ start:171 stop:887 length:717 start_codon:yes stop_codon:yes gene_type:complete
VGNNNKYTYEDKFETVDNEIRKRYYKWHLHALAWLDFDDVSQIIRAHIYKKWDQWDQQRPIEPWVNKIISNQLKNILRNNYSNFARPCISCKHNQSKEQSSGQIANLCSLTSSGLQSDECSDYAKWEKTRKQAYDIKIPVSLEVNQFDRHTNPEDHYNIHQAIDSMHLKMREYLSDRHFIIYKMLFIDHLDEELVAKVLGYKSNEKGRKAGYKQIKNLKNLYKKTAKRICGENDIFFQ